MAFFRERASVVAGAGNGRPTELAEAHWTMRHRRLLIALLFVGNAAVYFAGTLFTPSLDSWKMDALFGIVFGQAALLAIWAASAGRASPWRLVSAVIALSGWWWVFVHIAWR
jgi:hypothetical protein